MNRSKHLLIGIAEPDVEKEDKGERDPASGLGRLFFPYRVELIDNKDARSNALSLLEFLDAATEMQMIGAVERSGKRCL
jgi:hypothetical protein